MSPSRQRILTRSLRGHCPCCDGRRIFASLYRLRHECPDCGLPLEKEDGWGIGAIPLNYGFICIFWILPVCLLFAAGLLPLKPTLVLAGAGAVGVPFLTYRYAKSLWAGIYYAILPQDLRIHVKEKVPDESGTFES
jgi:uncharacterized protein (DUF983 family)